MWCARISSTLLAYSCQSSIVDFSKSLVNCITFVNLPNSSKTGEKYLAHAGIHFTQNNYNACCVTGDLIQGYWDGKQVILYFGLREPLSSKAMSTEKVQSGNY